MTAQVSTIIIGLLFTGSCLGIIYWFLREDHLAVPPYEAPVVIRKKKPKMRKRGKDRKPRKRSVSDTQYLWRISRCIAKNEGKMTRTQAFHECGLRRDNLNQLLVKYPNKIVIEVVVSSKGKREYIKAV